jgi:poly(hydroxyalkanoate) granule-associated protein
MAARKKARPSPSEARKTRARAARPDASMIDSVQQVWLAGMGAIARAQKEGQAAFQDAVAEGIKLLNNTRTTAEKMIRDAFDAAQGNLQLRMGSARDQASETLGNLETLFQGSVHSALQQLGVPTAEEIRLLTKRPDAVSYTHLTLPTTPYV